MARVKSDQERGPIGTWMKRERLSRDWSPERVVDALRDVTGTVVRVDYYRQLEARTAGRVPGPELLEDLATLFGSRPTPLPEPEPEAPDLSADTLALVAAIDRLTASVDARAREDQARLAAVVAQTVLAALRSAGALAG